MKIVGLIVEVGRQTVGLHQSAVSVLQTDVGAGVKFRQPFLCAGGVGGKPLLIGGLFTEGVDDGIWVGDVHRFFDDDLVVDVIA